MKTTLATLWLLISILAFAQNEKRDKFKGDLYSEKFTNKDTLANSLLYK